LGAIETTKTAVTISKPRVGAKATKADFHAPIWSIRFMGQITSSGDINGQSVSPPDIPIPINMGDRLKLMAPRRKNNIVLAIIFIFTTIA